MLDLIAQTAPTTQSLLPAFDPYRWIGWALAAVALLFTGLTIVYTHVMWVWIRLQNNVDGRPDQGHRRFLLLTVRNKGAELHDISVALVFMKDGKKNEQPMPCIGECPNPFKRNASRNFYLENSNPRRSMEAENMTEVWIEIRSGVIPVRALRAKKYRRTIEAWSKSDDKLPDPPAEDAPRPDKGFDWLRGRPKW